MSDTTTYRVSHRALLGYWLLIPLGAALYFAPSAFFGTASDTAHPAMLIALTWIGMGLAAWGLLNVAYQRLAHLYVVEPERIIERHGIIARRVTPLYISHIRSTEVNQSILGRLLGFGTVEMSAAGTGTSEARFDRVAHPMKVMDVINQHAQRQAGQGEASGE
jgi:uncharacterized membrane protein YdbT with pleckstrin-like domain